MALACSPVPTQQFTDPRLACPPIISSFLLPCFSFCTKPTVKLGKKVPSILYGPQLNITVDAGNCTLSKDGSLLDKDNKTVTCYGPSISYVKVRQAPFRYHNDTARPVVALLLGKAATG
jgi:hypothetical protein